MPPGLWTMAGGVGLGMGSQAGTLLQLEVLEGVVVRILWKQALVGAGVVVVVPPRVDL